MGSGVSGDYFVVVFLVERRVVAVLALVALEAVFEALDVVLALRVVDFLVVLVDFVVLAALAAPRRANLPPALLSSIFLASSRVIFLGSCSLGILILLKRPGPLI